MWQPHNQVRSRVTLMLKPKARVWIARIGMNNSSHCCREFQPVLEASTSDLLDLGLFALAFIRRARKLEAPTSVRPEGLLYKVIKTSWSSSS
jgi:hypothetical protein